MPSKTISFILKGMQRDLSVSKFNPEYAYENMNLRFTIDKDNTLVSIVNEKGTKEILLNTTSGLPTNILGSYIGHNVLDNIITIFTKSSTDRIYRMIYNYDEDSFSVDMLFDGDLNFDPKHPIETIGIYENEDVQKVYWLDGINQPRFINVAPSVDFSKFNNNSFNFAQSLKLNEDIKVVKNNNSSGIFAPGTIQYAFSYFNRYGQESSIFYSTPLNYISHTDRGGNAEDVVSNSFTINLNNLDYSFEYVRIYSIHRTSLDATPLVKRVADLSLQEGIELIESSHSLILGPYIFNTQDIDNIYLYKNNRLLRVNSFPSRRSTDLITGGVIYKWDIILSDKDRILNMNSLPSVSVGADYAGMATVSLRSLNSGTNTIYVNISTEPASPLKVSSYTIELSQTKNTVYVDTGISGDVIDPQELLFKGSELIIASTLAQKDNTLFLGDIKLARQNIPENIKDYFRGRIIEFDNDNEAKDILIELKEGSYPYKNQLTKDSNDIKSFKYLDWYRFGLQFLHKTGKWSEPIFIKDEKNNLPVNISQDLKSGKSPIAKFIGGNLNIIDDLVSLGYVRARGVVVYPGTSDREVIALGVIMPTVFNVEDRYNNSPFSISSWFARPNSPFDYLRSINDNSPLDSSGLIHTRALYLNLDCLDDGSALIESRHYHPIGGNGTRRGEILSSDGYTLSPYTVGSGADREFVENWGEVFFVDQSILTFHSPEIEMDDAILSLNSDDLKMRIVGLTPITGTISDIDVSIKNKPYLKKATGIYKRSPSIQNISRIGARSLSSGVNYMDDSGMSHLIWLELGFPVYPWHSNGSLRNLPPEDEGEIRYGLLDKNKRSNLRFSFNSLYYNPTNIWYPENGISDFLVFNSVDLSLLKLKSPDNSGVSGFTYYGNIDKIVSVSKSAGKENGFLYYSTDATVTLGSGIQAPSGWLYTAQLKTIALQSSNENLVRRSADPVHMRYKSGSHGVISINYHDDGSIIIPPTIYDSNGSQPKWPVNKIERDPGTLFWMKWGDWDRNIYQDVIDSPSTGGYSHNIGYGYFWLAEIYNDNVLNRFGGDTPDAIENNLWLPAGYPVSLINEQGDAVSSFKILYTEGDTFYLRYDCLKTYAYSSEDLNQVVDITSFMCETRINIDGRFDRNRGLKNNLSMNPSNFNLMNPVYSLKNNFFNYRALNSNRILPDNFSNIVTWSNSKQLGEYTDTWANITLASTLDMDGDKGRVRALRRFNNEIYSFQDKGISRILFNSRVLINTSDGVPIEIGNSLKVDGKVYINQGVGCLNKWSITSTPNGLYFIDNLGKSIYWFNGESFVSLSDSLGFRTFISELNSLQEWDNQDFNNFITHYDSANKDLYFTNKNHSLVYSETLGQFTSFYNYENVPLMFNSGHKNFIFKDNKLWEQWGGLYNNFFGEDKPFYTTLIVNPELLLDKVFNTLEFRADTYDDENLLHDKTFDNLSAWNEYQNGLLDLVNVPGKPSPLKKKFRIWRANIPRDNSNMRDRIRNPWIYLKLSMTNPGTYKTQLHDLMVNYFTLS